MPEKKEEGFDGFVKGLKEGIIENLSQQPSDLDKLDDERYQRERRVKPSRFISDRDEGDEDAPAKPGQSKPVKAPEI